MDLTNKWVKSNSWKPRTFFKLQKLYMYEYGCSWRHEAKGIGFYDNKVINSIKFDDMSDLVVCDEFELITSTIKNGLSLSELGICKDVNDLEKGISDMQDILSCEETYGMDEMFRLKIQEYKTKIAKIRLYNDYVRLSMLIKEGSDMSIIDGYDISIEIERDTVLNILQSLEHIKLVEQ